MDSCGIKHIVRYILRNCETTLTPKQSEQLHKMLMVHDCNIIKLRTLYRIAIDNFVFPECPHCHEPIKSQEDLTIDHIIPRSKGGTDKLTNLQPMHKKCNCDKGCTMPEKTTCADIPVKKTPETAQPNKTQRTRNSKKPYTRRIVQKMLQDRQSPHKQISYDNSSQHQIVLCWTIYNR